MNTTEIETRAKTLVNRVRTMAIPMVQSSWDKGRFYPDDEAFGNARIQGYRNLGAGGTRIAFERGGLVFKIEYRPLNEALGEQDERGYWANPQEFENYIRFLDLPLPPSWKVPPTDLIMVDDVPVIVMEYVGGRELDFGVNGDSDEVFRFQRATGLYDIEFVPENSRFVEDHYMVVDFAT